MLSALAVAGCILAVVLTGLQGKTTHSHEHAEQAVSAVNAVRRIDGLEWRALAGESPVEIRAAVEDATLELEETLSADADDLSNQLLIRETGIYATAVLDMLSALESGDTERAERIDDLRVDPGFETVIDLATDLAEEHAAAAEATEQTTRGLTWITTLGAVAALGVLLLALLEMRLRQANRSRDAEADRRFRALVEDSPDIITVVSGDGSLTVMSATLGPLGHLGAGSKSRVISELLPPEIHAAWQPIDARVAFEGGSHLFEFSVDQADGAVSYLQCHGSPMVDSPDERVWVWRDVTEQKELELQLSHQAFHDSLTGVANRALLKDRVDHALAISTRSGLPVALLFGDLDDFKTVNDSLGHGRGDELLGVVAARVAGCVRDGDTVARLGGDEFAVLLEDTDLATATSLAQRVIAAVAAEVMLAERPFFPSMSVGIAMAVPGSTTEELLRNADLAMYSAKRAGRGRAVPFENQMHEVSSELLELQRDLKAALADEGLSLHYQPTVDLTDGTVEGIEALVRWTHPTRGNVTPAQFIPIAEATGMIVLLGKWVLLHACRAAVELQAGRERPLLMHVNLSPQQLHDPGIVQLVEQTLAETGLPAAHLVLEVTEGFLLDDAVAVERLHELHAIGVLLAIDDFGTGYTSISYLQRLPVDILKIDRSFVSGTALADAERNSFLRAIVGLADSLHLRCVAEGIEEDAQLEELRQLGCDVGQGFLWTPARPLAETNAVIAEIEAARTGARAPHAEPAT
jgi:diguanylate cyclase (GGDEF)-like protein/PAS domain S-box-containing protein